MKTIIIALTITYAVMLAMEAAPAAANTVAQLSSYAQGGAR